MNVKRRRDRFINRELSWLEFNQRVLDLATDNRIPLLERVRFLAITSSNLDEFFMVRVGGLQMLAAHGGTKPDLSGLSPSEQLAAISARVHAMATQQYECFADELEPQLAQAGIRRLHADHLSDRQRKHCERIFEREIFPVLSPMAYGEQARPPLLINRAIYLGVRLKGKRGRESVPRFAVLPLSRQQSRLVTLPSEQDGYEFMLMEDLVALFIESFFPGESIRECATFRVTRNADMSVREDLAADLLAEMEAVLDARKRSECARLEIDERARRTFESFLQRSLGVPEQAVYRVSGPLDLSALVALCDLKGFDRHLFEPWSSQPSVDIPAGAGMFDAIKRRDLLLYHPFDSFEPVVRLVEQAARDPDVVAIKQVLYRTSRHSPIIAALKRAAQEGKYVTAIVELKARFDEARNIEWARELEDEGAQVIFGVKGLKTHAKVCIIIRREADGLRRYVHFGTGNYNESTARSYTDVSYITVDEDLGADASMFFNAITGYSQPQKYNKLEAAPIGLRQGIIGLIEAEMERKRQGAEAFIMGKMNSLVDPMVIRALYSASQAGVRIDLNVRGICCLKPGVPGLSENIRVMSIVDRFLEHSRIFCFCSGGRRKVFISSADWMPRNFDRRVELLVPVEEPGCRARLVSILDTCMSDTSSAWHLRADGSYGKVAVSGRKRRVRSQEALYQEARKRVEAALRAHASTFEPRRPQKPST